MGDTGSEFVGYEVQDGVAWARIDHGKANALSFEVLDALGRCLTLAEDDDAVGALCITGKPGFLTGGFDLSVMKSGDAKAMVGLVANGGCTVHADLCVGAPGGGRGARSRGRGGGVALPRGRRAHRRRRVVPDRADRDADRDGAARGGRSSSRRSV